MLQKFLPFTGIDNPGLVKAEPLSTSPTPSEDAEDQEDLGDSLNPSVLLRQINQLGPSERCSPIQAGNMGKKLLTIIAYHEQNNLSLPGTPSVCELCVCHRVYVCGVCGVTLPY